MNGEDLPFAPPKRNDLYIVPTGIRPVMRRTAVEVIFMFIYLNSFYFELLSCLVTSNHIENILIILFLFVYIAFIKVLLHFPVDSVLGDEKHEAVPASLNHIS